MVNIAREAAQAVWHGTEHAAEDAASWFHRPSHPYTSAAPAAATTTATTEEHMTVPVIDELKHLLDVADEDALKAVNAVLAHPEGPAVLADLAAVAGLPVPAGTISAAANGLKAVLAAVSTQLRPAGT